MKKIPFFFSKRKRAYLLYQCVNFNEIKTFRAPTIAKLLEIKLIHCFMILIHKAHYMFSFILGRVLPKLKLRYSTVVLIEKFYSDELLRKSFVK